MDMDEVVGQVLKAAMATPQPHDGTKPGHEAPNIPFGTVEFWIVLVVCLCLVGFAAIMSGLTMAYMSIDPLNLGILQASGSVQDQTYAAAIAPLLKNRHYLLVTLLVGNATAMEALPIFLDKLVPSYVAVILSVSLVLIFGEIIPQAVFTKYRLCIGAYMAIFVRTLEFLTSPICWPIATILDYVLGDDHETVYRRCELKELTKMHAMDKQGHGTLSAEEVRMMVGTLELGDKQVKDAMQPFKDIFMIGMDQVLDATMLSSIYSQGHSRIPVYNSKPEDIRGFLLVKNLILVSAEDKVTLREVAGLCVKPLTRVRTVQPLFDLLRHLKQRKTHIALVVEDDDFQGTGDLHDRPVVGLISMEDVIEELLQEEIEDETDGESVNRAMNRIAEMYLHRKSVGTRARRATDPIKSTLRKSESETPRRPTDWQMGDMSGGGRAGAAQGKSRKSPVKLDRLRGMRSEGTLPGFKPLLDVEEAGGTDFDRV